MPATPQTVGRGHGCTHRLRRRRPRSAGPSRGPLPPSAGHCRSAGRVVCGGARAHGVRRSWLHNSVLPARTWTSAGEGATHATRGRPRHAHVAQTCERHPCVAADCSPRLAWRTRLLYRRCERNNCAAIRCSAGNGLDRRIGGATTANSPRSWTNLSDGATVSVRSTTTIETQPSHDRHNWRGVPC